MLSGRLETKLTRDGNHSPLHVPAGRCQRAKHGTLAWPCLSSLPPGDRQSRLRFLFDPFRDPTGSESTRSAQLALAVFLALCRGSDARSPKLSRLALTSTAAGGNAHARLRVAVGDKPNTARLRLDGATVSLARARLGVRSRRALILWVARSRNISRSSGCESATCDYAFLHSTPAGQTRPHIRQQRTPFCLRITRARTRDISLCFPRSVLAAIHLYSYAAVKFKST